MSIQFIDLHTHSTASDGADSPSALVQKAAQLKLAALALTDHDTLDGLEEAELAGERLGVEIIRGCELSTHSEYGEVHLLGLWMPRQAQALSPLLQRLDVLQEYRIQRNEAIMKKLQDLGIKLTWADIKVTGKIMGRPHIALALVKKKVVRTHREAFDRFLGAGKPAYVPRQSMPTGEAVALLAGMGCTVAIAHPRLIRCSVLDLEKLVASLKDYGLTALEAYHTEHGSADVRLCVDLAKKYNLALCGGSDYHGLSKPLVHLGHGKGSLRVALHILEALKQQRIAAKLPL